MTKKLTKLGFLAVLRNPVRLVVALLLTVFSIGVTSCMLTLRGFDQISMERAPLLKAPDAEFITLTVGDGILEGEGTHFPSYGLNVKQAEELGARLSEFGCPYAYRTEKSAVIDYSRFFRDQKKAGTFDEEDNFAPYAPWTGSNEFTTGEAMIALSFLQMRGTVFSGEEFLQEAGIPLYGRLPAGLNEVAVPDYIYRSFCMYGYYDPFTGETADIRSEDDLIGKTVYLWAGWDWYYQSLDEVVPAKIVGIMGVDLTSERFLKYLGTTQQDPSSTVANSEGLCLIVEDPGYTIPVFATAVSKEYFEKCGELYKMTGVSVVRDTPYFDEWFRLATSWRKWQYPGKAFPSMKTKISYRYPGGSGSLLNGLSSVYSRRIAPYRVLLNLSPLFLVVTVGYFVYFCLASVNAKSRSIGVLRSLGATNRQVFLSFAVPLILFGLIAGACSIAIPLWYVHSINYARSAINIDGEIFWTKYYLSEPLFAVSPLSYVFSFVFPIIVGLVSVGIVLFLCRKRSVAQTLSRAPRSLFRRKKY